jgi:hypothetical protein
VSTRPATVRWEAVRGKVSYAAASIPYALLRFSAAVQCCTLTCGVCAASWLWQRIRKHPRPGIQEPLFDNPVLGDCPQRFDVGGAWPSGLLQSLDRSKLVPAISEGPHWRIRKSNPLHEAAPNPVSFLGAGAQPKAGKDPQLLDRLPLRSRQYCWRHGEFDGLTPRSDRQ